MSMTQTVARLRELMKLATPGSWWVGETYQDDEGCPEIPVHADIPHIRPHLITPLATFLQFPGYEVMQECNAALIAESHNALPLLLAELERLEGVLKLSQSALRHWQSNYADWADDMPVKMDRRLPPGNHIEALEAIGEALSRLARESLERKG